jgi:hypothetical protein
MRSRFAGKPRIRAAHRWIDAGTRFSLGTKMSPEIYKIAERSNGSVCTIGSCTTKPGIVTSVVEECRITLDQRFLARNR